MKVAADFCSHVWSSDEAKVQACGTRFFLCPYTTHTGWANFDAFLPHTGWVKLDTFLPHKGWVNRGLRPPRPSEFPVPDPRKEKQVQLHPPPEVTLKMMDLRNHTYKMIKGLRWVPKNHRWDKTKENGSNHDLVMSFSKHSIRTTNTYP
jgi:hypothetical protein